MAIDCFGGTGVVDYAFADIKNVKAVVPFHGGLTSLAPIETDVVHPYVLVQSGGEDDAHGNNTELELMLNGGNATWEITRYSGAFFEDILVSRVSIESFSWFRCCMFKSVFFRRVPRLHRMGC